MPPAISWSAIDFASLIGIEKPSPMLPDCDPPPVEPSEAIEDGMPMTRPVVSRDRVESTTRPPSGMRPLAQIMFIAGLLTLAQPCEAG